MPALRMPRPDEMAEDDEQTSLQEMAWCVEAEIAEEDAKEDKPKKIPQWRNGPAKLWYDILDVPQGTVEKKDRRHPKRRFIKNSKVLTFIP